MPNSDEPAASASEQPSAAAPLPQAPDTLLRDSEVRVNNAEAALHRAERLLRRKELTRAPWKSPLVIAILAAAIAALGNAVVALIASNGQIELEDRKAENARVLEVIKTGDPDKAATNLDFLVKTGLIADPTTRQKLMAFLSTRPAGTGPALPTAAPPPTCERIESIRALGWSSGHKTQFCVARGFDGVFNPFGDYAAGGFCFKGESRACISKIQSLSVPDR